LSQEAYVCDARAVNMSMKAWFTGSCLRRISAHWRFWEFFWEWELRNHRLPITSLSQVHWTSKHCNMYCVYNFIFNFI